MSDPQRLADVAAEWRAQRDTLTAMALRIARRKAHGLPTAGLPDLREVAEVIGGLDLCIRAVEEGGSDADLAALLVVVRPRFQFNGVPVP